VTLFNYEIVVESLLDISALSCYFLAKFFAHARKMNPHFFSHYFSNKNSKLARWATNASTYRIMGTYCVPRWRLLK
jgi:hypothetical protein